MTTRTATFEAACPSCGRAVTVTAAEADIRGGMSRAFERGSLWFAPPPLFLAGRRFH